MRTLCGPSGDREDDKVTFAEGAAQRLGVGVLDIRRIMVRTEQFPLSCVTAGGWRIPAWCEAAICGTVILPSAVGIVGLMPQK